MNGLALPVIFVTYAIMVFGTATFNAILVQILTPLLRKVLKRVPEKDAAKAQTPARVSSHAANGIVELRNFTFKYYEGDEPVVRDVNLSIPAGAFVGITGAANATRTGSNTEHTPASSVAPTAAESATPVCPLPAFAPQFTLVQLLPLRFAISLTAT